MRIADGWNEITETWFVCPYCFTNEKLESKKFHKEGDVCICPECGEEFQLGESA